MAEVATATEAPKRKRGRPAQNKKVWRTVIRLPEALSVELKKATKANGVSINTAIESLVELWVESENKN